MISYEQQLSNLQNALKQEQEEMPQRKAEWVKVARTIGINPAYEAPDYQSLLDLIHELERQGVSSELIVSSVRDSISDHWKGKPDEEVYANQLLTEYKRLSVYFHTYLEGKDSD